MKTVIEMAKEAEFENLRHQYWDCTTEGIERFAELVRADERNSWPAEMEAMERQVNILTDALAQEREACAKVCDDWAKTSYLSEAKSCAKIIRSRSNT